jgi:hypothetical protein
MRGAPPDEVPSLSLGDYLAQLRERGAPAFATQHTAPVLIARARATAQDPSDFNTNHSHPAIAPPMPRATLLESATAIVVPLIKRPGRPFPERIGIGRAPNTDVSLRLRGVSKYHAYFTGPDAEGRCWLTDAGSTNGTWLDARRLAPHEPAELVDGTDVAFGSTHFVFLTAPGLCALLASSGEG